MFNVLDVDAYRLLDHADMLAVAGRDRASNRCPQLGHARAEPHGRRAGGVLGGTSVLNPKAQREGIVLRPLVEEYDEDIGGRLSFKAINPKFLLKYDE